MRINSAKKAVFAGFLYAIMLFGLYIIFTYSIACLTEGAHFVTQGDNLMVVNGVSFVFVQIAGVILSALLPIFFLRYDSTENCSICIFIAAICYIIMFFLLLFLPWKVIKDSPLNSFDAVIYGIFIFPLGSVIGLLAAGIVNWFIRKKVG